MLMAVIETGRISLDIILIGAAAGIMVGILSISGLAFSMTIQLLALSGENVFLLLLLIAVLAFVLGIGLPTVSVYILTATLLAPALIKLGVTPMAAHMFVMYNGMLSMITPPVAFAAYAAANIARTDGWTTGWVACLVGWSTFILPFLFVLTPSLLMDGPAYLIVWNFCARPVRAVRRHRRHRRLCAGAAVGAGARALRRAGAADRAAAGDRSPAGITSISPASRPASCCWWSTICAARAPQERSGRRSKRAAKGRSRPSSRAMRASHALRCTHVLV